MTHSNVMSYVTRRIQTWCDAFTCDVTHSYVCGVRSISHGQFFFDDLFLKSKGRWTMCNMGLQLMWRIQIWRDSCIFNRLIAPNPLGRWLMCSMLQPPKYRWEMGHVTCEFVMAHVTHAHAHTHMNTHTWIYIHTQAHTHTHTHTCAHTLTHTHTHTTVIVVENIRPQIPIVETYIWQIGQKRPVYKKSPWKEAYVYWRSYETSDSSKRDLCATNWWKETCIYEESPRKEIRMFWLGRSYQTLDSSKRDLYAMNWSKETCLYEESARKKTCIYWLSRSYQN